MIQYDFGKTIQDKQFVVKGSLNKPPAVLTNAISKLRAKARRKGYDFHKHLKTMLEQNSIMAPEFKRPERDDLYAADYIHEGTEKDCQGCSLTRLITRSARPEPSSKVFYGTIGSANQVLRDADLRDKLHGQTGVICFEMEAAGLMDNFPCIVVRGICGKFVHD